MSDNDTRRMLAASIERILGEHCPTSMVRECDLGGAGGGAATAADALVGAREGAGFDAAMSGEASGGAGLGWADVRAVIAACGYHAAPIALADTFAAQGLARIAGSSLVPGWATLASGRVTGEGIEVDASPWWPHAATLVVSIADDAREGSATVWSFRAPASASGRNIAGESRASWVLDPANGVELGTVDHGVGALEVGAAVRSAQLAGACARAIRLSADYARDRIQFGRPIATFQAIQQQLALAQEWSSMAAAASALALSDDGVALEPSRVAAAKHVAGQAAEICARVAHAVHGAIGVTAEYDLQLFTRRLWSWSTEFGSQTYWAERLGAGLVGSDAVRSWDQVVRHASVSPTT